jgi:hypothetical protein
MPIRGWATEEVKVIDSFVISATIKIKLASSWILNV